MKGRLERSPEEEEKFHRLARVGLIKVGYKDEKDRPKSTDYFLATGAYEELFKEKYGSTPKKLLICFASDDASEVCNEELQCWGTKATGDAGKLLAYGGMKTFMLWQPGKREGERGQYAETPREKMPPKLGTWRRLLTLRFLLPELPIIGYWQLTTAAKDSSQIGIISVFDWVQKHAGTVVNVPFDMTVQFAISRKPGESKRYPVIQIVPNVSHVHLTRIKQFKEILDRTPGLITDDRLEKLVEDQKALPAPNVEQQENVELFDTPEYKVCQNLDVDQLVCSEHGSDYCQYRCPHPYAGRDA